MYVMQPDTNYSANTSEGVFVKHPILLGSIAAVTILALFSYWLYTTISEQPVVSPAVDQSLPNKAQTDIVQSLPPPIASTTPAENKKLMQMFPPPSPVTKQQTTGVTQNKTTNTAPVLTEEEKKILKLFPPPVK